MRRRSSPNLPPDGTSLYEVKNADSLASIAAHFGTTTSVLKSLNRLMSDLVYPGQMIYVPIMSRSESLTLDNSTDNKVPSSLSCHHIGTKSKTSTGHRSGTGGPRSSTGGPWSITGGPRSSTGAVTVTDSLEFVPPQPLTPEEVKLISDQCDQRFIKLQVSRILDDQDDPVKGVMLVTPDFVMFDPDESTQSNTMLQHSMTAPMSSVLSVSVYHDALPRSELAAASTARDDDDDDDDDGGGGDGGGDDKSSATRHGGELPSTTDINIVDCRVDNTDNRDDRDDSDKAAMAAAAADGGGDEDDVDRGDECGRDEVFSVKFAVGDDERTNVECRRDRQSDEKLSHKQTMIDSRLQQQATSHKLPLCPLDMCLCVTVESPSPPSPPSSPTLLRSASSSSHDSCFWYFVPYDRVDELYAFFIQWSPNVEADDEGFVVVSENISAQMSEPSPSEPRLLRSASINKDWEIINVKEMRRRLSEAELENLPLPELSRTSDILQDFHLRTLMGHLPARAEGSSWHLLYSSSVHGCSLRTLYRQMMGVDSPILLVVMDTQHHVFGTMQLTAIRRSDLFYGTGESYLFTFYPEFQKYGWTGANSYFTKADEDGLCFGAGRGCYGLWLDESLYHGTTRPCRTYDNKLLTTSEDFTVNFVEVWGFR